MAALIVAVVAVGIIVFATGSTYKVNAVFENASQIVAGDLVEVSGNAVGKVTKITLTPDDQADLTLDINSKPYEPLRQGTTATVREVSLSGIANRYVDLDLAPANHPSIPNGGTIPETQTTSEVDLDEIFDTLNGPTRRGLENLIQGSASQYKGAGAKAAAAFQYLNPAIAASSMLFAAINHDTSRFTRFITKSSALVTSIAHRQSDLSALIRNLNGTTSALADQHTALGDAIGELPGFETSADTTFANLRTALNDLTPLVNVSKPVAPKLEKLLVQLRPFAADSVPTLKDLSSIISKPGKDNDLIDLTKLGVPLAKATVDNIKADGKTRRGAFPESTIALEESTPELAYARPYSVDLTGWFEGFSHPGQYDANGGFSRVAPVIGLGSLDDGLTKYLEEAADPSLRCVIAFGVKACPAVPASDESLLESLLDDGGLSKTGLVTTDQADRCPGSMERGDGPDGSSEYYPETGYACTESQVPTGK